MMCGFKPLIFIHPFLWSIFIIFLFLQALIIELMGRSLVKKLAPEGEKRIEQYHRFRERTRNVLSMAPGLLTITVFGLRKSEPFDSIQFSVYFLIVSIFLSAF